MIFVQGFAIFVGAVNELKKDLEDRHPYYGAGRYRYCTGGLNYHKMPKELIDSMVLFSKIEASRSVPYEHTDAALFQIDVRIYCPV